MCNACHNVCCGSDMFSGCGCNECDCEDCWDEDESEDDDAEFACEAIEPEANCICSERRRGKRHGGDGHRRVGVATDPLTANAIS